MVGLIITLVVTVPIAIIWVNAIDKVPKDYKGEEFLNWDRQHDNWDESHTETEF